MEFNSNLFLFISVLIDSLLYTYLLEGLLFEYLIEKVLYILYIYLLEKGV
jgi:hypothetical protein